MNFGRIFAIIQLLHGRRNPMYEVEFYETKDGVSELWDFLEDLKQKAEHSKDARIQHSQIAFYIQLLQDHGIRLGENITKHLDENIWELRPGNNRVPFFSLRTTHLFCCISSERKPKKTPRREIERAKSERDDWISRKG